MTHGTQGQQWIDDEIRKAEKMTNETEAPDISPDAVNKLADGLDNTYSYKLGLCVKSIEGEVMRAQAARIAALGLQVLAAHTQAVENLERAEAAEAKLAKALEAQNTSLSARIAELETESESWRQECLAQNKALFAANDRLAELTTNPTERETP